MQMLAAELAAQVHQPLGLTAPAWSDKLRARLLGSADLWTLARGVLAGCTPRDVVFCSSEAGGFQLAALASAMPSRPRIAVFVHNVNRPKGRLALRLWQLRNQIDLFLACSMSQVVFLREYLQLSDERVRHVWDHTDTQFFTPGSQSPDKRRPLIVSVGLEQRDYRTLASAAGDLAVEIRVSGFSKDAAAMAETFPAVMPPNMSKAFYPWPDLVQLYRDADVVAVSCKPNRYAAGVQSLMEASACRRPLVVTSTEGLRAYLNDGAISVPPGDVAAMRAAILDTLRDREAAEHRAELAYRMAQSRYGMERYVSELVTALRALAQSS
jgi:glycosyltransferase involved in cell wall biosynthesis